MAKPPPQIPAPAQVRREPAHPLRAGSRSARCYRAEPVADRIAGEPHQRHGGRKCREGETGGLDRGAEFVPQVERGPVEHRAFRDHAEQSDQADQPRQECARQGQWRLVPRPAPAGHAAHRPRRRRRDRGRPPSPPANAQRPQPGDRTPPLAAPTSPPRLQKPWQEDIIARRMPRSTATALAFIATSMPPTKPPSRNKASAAATRSAPA